MRSRSRRTSCVSGGGLSAQPQQAPDALAPAALDALPYPTPFLVLDHERVAAAYLRLRRALPGVALHYAVKCNPERALLARLHRARRPFEIASLPELESLVALGVDPGRVLYSNPVKPPPTSTARRARRHEVRRRLARRAREALELAPGAEVYVRIDARDATSRVPLAGKFGVDPAAALALLLEARALGLRPHGLTFHVGSQALDPAAYTRAIGLAAEVMRVARATASVSSCSTSAAASRRAMPIRYRRSRRTAARSRRGSPRLPYPVRVVAEPGRALVAEAGVLATTVIGVAERHGRRWSTSTSARSTG